jgi:hypothetical protein
MSAEMGVTEQQNDPEDEHLGRQEAKHSSRHGEAGAFADIARDLRELYAREVNFLPRQVRSVLRHVAEELPDSATRLGCARHLHG